MKICNLAATLLTITLTLGVSQAAHADPNPDRPGKPESQTCTVTLHTLEPEPHECALTMHDVWKAIDALDLGGPNAHGKDDKTNLKLKVCAADNKLHVIPPKTQDAIDKLEDIKLTVSNKKKIAKADKDDITKYADIAIGCLLATL